MQEEGKRPKESSQQLTEPCRGDFSRQTEQAHLHDLTHFFRDSNSHDLEGAKYLH